jgi:hypothetical protein
MSLLWVRSLLADDLFDPDENEWMHGTDEDTANDLHKHDSGFHGLQVHGPGLYVTRNRDHAEQYAKATAQFSGKRPVVQYGVVHSENPVSVTHRQLEGLGREFRDAHPGGNKDYNDAAMGNLALRARGHDFIHVHEGVYGDPIDVGIIVKPRRWIPTEDHDVKDES